MTMNVNFLCLDPQDVAPARITSELIPMVNAYLLEFYNIKKQMQDETLDPEIKKQITQKFKLIVDLIEIYKNPSLLKLIKDMQEEKERERLRVVEMERKRQEMLQIQREREQARNSSGLFDDFWNLRSIIDDSTDDDINSNVSEDDFHQDKYMDMLKKAHDSIYTNSTLQHNFTIHRRYHCGFEDSDTSENLDPETPNGETNETKSLTDQQASVNTTDINTTNTIGADITDVTNNGEQIKSNPAQGLVV